jgi:hypothetical protein
VSSGPPLTRSRSSISPDPHPRRRCDASCHLSSGWIACWTGFWARSGIFETVSRLKKFAWLIRIWDLSF